MATKVEWTYMIKYQLHQIVKLHLAGRVMHLRLAGNANPCFVELDILK